MVVTDRLLFVVWLCCCCSSLLLLLLFGARAGTDRQPTMCAGRPLLYHYEEMPDPSIELTLEDIYAVAESYGLEFVRKEEGRECSYTSNCRSLMRTRYHCSFFTAIKRR